MADTIKLDIPKSSAERVARTSALQILQWFKDGSLNNEQAVAALVDWRDCTHPSDTPIADSTEAGRGVQGSIARKQSSSPESYSASELGILRSIGWINPPDDAPKFFGATVEYKNGCLPKLPMKAVWDGTPVRIVAVAKTDADAQRDDGLVSGVSSDPT